MKIKPGVSLLGLQPQMIIAVIAANDIWAGLDQELVITSCTDGVHRKGSLHYKGLALDLRTRDFSDADKEKAFAELAEALGQAYDTVLESTHIHVEWDPETNRH